MNSGRLLFEGRGKGGGKEKGRRAHHRVLNHGTLATLDRSPIEITAKLGVEQSRINQPVNYSRGGNIGGESVAREVSIGRDTIQIDEVKIQTSPLGNLRLIDARAESSYDGTRFE